MQAKTKSQAKALGLSKYFTGKPCKRGHVCERYAKGHCVECEKDQLTKWSRKNPEKRREYYLRDMGKHREKRLAAKRLDSKTPRAKAADRLRRYGWTQEQYDTALVAQGGRCVISGMSGRLHADHCHVTGSPRALLDSRINVGLGAFSDNPEWLCNAAAYVLLHRPLVEWVQEYTEPGGRAFG